MKSIRGGWLNRTVAGAGVTSALGDLCYETATVLLPGFLAVLGAPAAILGVIEGAADALASFTKMFSGYFADRFGHRKLLVMLGYGLTPVGQALIAAAPVWPMILAGRLLSWFGKGLRGPLRDAIVAQAIAPENRGRAFGFHRAMDTVGAILGPAAGVLLLSWAQQHGGGGGGSDGPFRVVLWLSLVPGAAAVVAFLLLVRDPEHSPNPSLRLAKALRGLPDRFRRYLLAVGVFGLGDFSHSLLILSATQVLSNQWGVVQAAQLAGGLYVCRNIVQTLCSFPAGYLADRYGAMKVLVMGYALGAATALAAASVHAFQLSGLAPLAIVFSLAGLYTAVQEAIESTVTAGVVSKDILATGYGALGTVNGAAKFASSAAVGVLWTALSPQAAFLLAAVLMSVGTFFMGRLTSLWNFRNRFSE